MSPVVFNLLLAAVGIFTSVGFQLLLALPDLPRRPQPRPRRRPRAAYRRPTSAFGGVYA